MVAPGRLDVNMGPLANDGLPRLDRSSAWPITYILTRLACMPLRSPAQTHVKTKVNRHVFQALAHDRYTTPASMPLSASPTKSSSPRFRLSCSDLSNQWRPKRLPETAPHSRMVWELCMAWLNTSSPIIVSGSWLSFAQKQLVFQTPARMAMSQLRR
jgi:hypothetical protein